MTRIATLEFWVDEGVLVDNRRTRRLPEATVDWICESTVEVQTDPENWIRRSDSATARLVDTSAVPAGIAATAALPDRVKAALVHHALWRSEATANRRRERLVGAICEAVVAIAVGTPEAAQARRLTAAIRAIQKGIRTTTAEVLRQVPPLDVAGERTEVMRRLGEITAVRLELATSQAPGDAEVEVQAHILEAIDGVAARIEALKQYEKILREVDYEVWSSHRASSATVAADPPESDPAGLTDAARRLAAEATGDRHLAQRFADPAAD